MKNRFGDTAYAMEELVAELGAAFLCADLGLASEPRPDHAAYISDWLKALKREPKALTNGGGEGERGGGIHCSAWWLRTMTITDPPCPRAGFFLHFDRVNC